MMKTKFAATAGVFALIGLSIAACSKPKTAAPTAAAPLTVSVVTVESRPLAEGLSASGSLVSREESGVSSELSGFRVAEVMADEGQWVKKGQPLARLDDTLMKAQIAQQTANLNQQQVAAERAHAEADRVKGLDNEGVISQEQISERRLAAKSADAAVAVAKAGLNDLMTREQRMTIRAPVSGRILERTGRPGDTSAPGTTLYRIAKDGLVELDAEVDESDLARVKLGSSVRVSIPSGDSAPGRVRFISPRVDPQSKLGHVRIALPVRADLRPGGFATVTFNGLAKPAPSVPEAAIHYDADGAYVLEVDTSDHVHRRPIKTGRRANGFVELLQGPGVGARVALGGSAFVLEGDRVRTVAATATPPARQ
jgi:HlyD family secretion protein